MRCTCFIVPASVLKKLAQDSQLDDAVREASADSALISTELRKLRTQAGRLTRVAMAQAPADTRGVLAMAPAVTVYDCQHKQTLPGAPVASPTSSTDATAQRTFAQTRAVADFYQAAFGRNSIDNAGMTMMSSVHYGVKYNNAMWNGSQMVYGDGDAAIFVDFTNGNDVIGHELTHGVTQYTLQLGYSGDAGGLNESLSDCFGSMFRQWQAQQTVAKADWLIGRDIMGPTAKAKGYTCLRNMANPADKKALSPQPTLYSQLTPSMDPHLSSGPPNLAFYTACKTLGGKSWEKIGQVWYHAMTDFGASPTLKMKKFADRTRQVAAQLYPKSPTVAKAVDAGWKQVGL